MQKALTIVLATISFGVFFFANAQYHGEFIPAYGFLALGIWQVKRLFFPSNRKKTILKLMGFKWDLNDFCRGWLITGMTGSGKTTSAINNLLWQISKKVPNWGGVCIDEKGLFWETLTSMFEKLGRKKDLILLQVRPDDADSSWKPLHTFNFLKIPDITYSAHAKTICDVAASLGQEGGNPFFKTQAQIHIEWALKALDASNENVSLKDCFEFLNNSKYMNAILERLNNSSDPGHKAIWSHFERNFKYQPPEQLGGVKQTVFNYLKYFTDPAIAEIFCSEESTFDFADIDKGKVICLSIPQKYPIERKYLNTLLKLTYYRHAVRRFDKPENKRKNDNLLILWADEAQKVVTSNQDGMSDYNTVDVIREAKATVIAATQSYLSLVPPMGNENKTKVFISNLGNRITFKAADEESAQIAANTLGKKEHKKYTQNVSKGSNSRSYSIEEKHHLAPHEFRKLKKFECVLQHCEQGWKRGRIKPLGRDGKTPKWY